MIITVHWDGLESDSLEVVEERARAILNVYGFSSVKVKALRAEQGILIELTGARRDTLKAKDIFEH